MTKKEVSLRIKYLRNRANLSARALSLTIGYNQNYINRLETNYRFYPNFNTLSDIFAVCDSSFEEFFYHDINQYQIDKELIEKLKKASPEKKELALKILEM